MTPVWSPQAFLAAIFWGHLTADMLHIKTLSGSYVSHFLSDSALSGIEHLRGVAVLLPLGHPGLSQWR